jgi:hypothetical protein
MISTSYRPRTHTRVIVQHVLSDLPESLTERDVDAIFRSLGLCSSPFHFIQLPNGDIEDGLDVTAVGGYFHDSIDIAVLCVGQEPSTAQQENLNDLIQALLMDHPLDAQPDVIRIHEQQFGNRATA